jgi:hypothetical protein
MLRLSPHPRLRSTESALLRGLRPALSHTEPVKGLLKKAGVL